MFRVLTIQNPEKINLIGFFMNQALNDANMGAALYFSKPPQYTSLEFLGAIANQRPSDIFHTGWALNPEVNCLSEVKLVVTIEPLEKLETCVRVSQETDLNQAFAQKVALNMVNYMQSFGQVSNAVDN